MFKSLLSVVSNEGIIDRLLGHNNSSTQTTVPISDIIRDPSGYISKGFHPKLEKLHRLYLSGFLIGYVFDGLDNLNYVFGVESGYTWTPWDMPFIFPDGYDTRIEATKLLNTYPTLSGVMPLRDIKSLIVRLAKSLGDMSNAHLSENAFFMAFDRAATEIPEFGLVRKGASVTFSGNTSKMKSTSQKLSACVEFTSFGGLQLPWSGMGNDRSLKMGSLPISETNVEELIGGLLAFAQLHQLEVDHDHKTQYIQDIARAILTFYGKFAQLTLPISIACMKISAQIAKHIFTAYPGINSGHQDAWNGVDTWNTRRFYQTYDDLSDVMYYLNKTWPSQQKKLKELAKHLDRDVSKIVLGQ